MKEKIETKFCQHCGKKINKKAEICPKCGVRVKKPPIYTPKKSAGLAAILSLFIPGLGQIYNGQIVKGIIILFVDIILTITAFVLTAILIGIVLWLPVFIISLYAMWDAYETAKKINVGEIKT